MKKTGILLLLFIVGLIARSQDSVQYNQGFRLIVSPGASPGAFLPRSIGGLTIGAGYEWKKGKKIIATNHFISLGGEYMGCSSPGPVLINNSLDLGLPIVDKRLSIYWNSWIGNYSIFNNNSECGDPQWNISPQMGTGFSTRYKWPRKKLKKQVILFFDSTLGVGPHFVFDTFESTKVHQGWLPLPRLFFGLVIR